VIRRPKIADPHNCLRAPRGPDPMRAPSGDPLPSRHLNQGNKSDGDVYSRPGDHA
jgi:hypothetical protein